MTDETQAYDSLDAFCAEYDRRRDHETDARLNGRESARSIGIKSNSQRCSIKQFARGG